MTVNIVSPFSTALVSSFSRLFTLIDFSTNVSWTLPAFLHLSLAQSCFSSSAFSPTSLYSFNASAFGPFLLLSLAVVEQKGGRR